MLEFGLRQQKIRAKQAYLNYPHPAKLEEQRGYINMPIILVLKSTFVDIWGSSHCTTWDVINLNIIRYS